MLKYSAFCSYNLIHIMSWNLPERKIFLSPIGNNLAPTSISHVLKGKKVCALFRPGWL